MAARKTTEPDKAEEKTPDVPPPAPEAVSKVTVSTVTVETPDHAAIEKERREKAEAEHAATLRKQQVEGLENELAYLERTPNPDAKRVAAVKEQISVYSEKPARTRETR